MSRPAIKTKALAGRIRQALSGLSAPSLSLKTFKTQFGFAADPPPVDLDQVSEAGANEADF